MSLFGTSDSSNSDLWSLFSGTGNTTTTTSPTSKNESNGGLFSSLISGGLDLGKTFIQTTGLVDFAKATNSNGSTLQADANSGVRIGGTYITYGLIALAGIAVVGGILLLRRK